MSVLVLTWLWTGAAYSQTSTNYTIPRDVLDEGGGITGSTNYRQTSSIGQPSDSGNSSSDNYTGIYVTDSDDYIEDLKLLPVSLVDDLWYLDSANDYGYSGWFIGGVQALDRRDPIPEPGTLILIALGLLSLGILIRKRVKHRK